MAGLQNPTRLLSTEISGSIFNTIHSTTISTTIYSTNVIHTGNLRHYSAGHSNDDNNHGELSKMQCADPGRGKVLPQLWSRSETEADDRPSFKTIRKTHADGQIALRLSRGSIDSISAKNTCLCRMCRNARALFLGKAV